MPAGAGHDQPDLLLEYKKKKAGCELKITAASAGSLVMKYDINDKKNPWKFGDIKEDDDEKIFIRDLTYEVDLFSIIKKQWKEVPYKRDKDAKWEATAGKLTPQQRYVRLYFVYSTHISCEVLLTLFLLLNQINQEINFFLLHLEYY